ncbi:MAG: hypothetical protein AAF721_11595 [Myxococcota bacterium]
MGPCCGLLVLLVQLTGAGQLAPPAAAATVAPPISTQPRDGDVVALRTPHARWTRHPASR